MDRKVEFENHSYEYTKMLSARNDVQQLTTVTK